MLWKTFDMPDNGGQPGGYSGGAIWQPPAIDPKRGTLFIGTGNNYSVPADVEACQNATPTANCAAADDFFDAALALDLKTGQIKWSMRLQGFDTWTVACLTPTGPKANCPVPTSPDFDLEDQDLIWSILLALARRAASSALNPIRQHCLSTPVGLGAARRHRGTATDGRANYVAVAIPPSCLHLGTVGQRITQSA
jgi:polyvinyl alcohol dehydrogenase (cytochrome)